MVSGVRIVDMLMIIGWWSFFLQAKEEAPELMAQKSKLEEEKIAKEKEVTEAWAAVEARLREVGNLVHDSVPVDNNEVRSAQRIGASRVLGFMFFFFFEDIRGILQFNGCLRCELVLYDIPLVVF